MIRTTASIGVALILALAAFGCESEEDQVFDSPYYTGADASPLVTIPAGGFMRGSPSNGTDVYFGDQPEEGFSDEWPRQVVELSQYQIELYEVTNAQYRACVLAEACEEPAIVTSLTRDWYYTNPDYDLYPVLGVTWFQAEQYCTWRGRRLPTEAEWEKAARGAADDRDWPWGPDQPECSKTNYGAIIADDQGNRYTGCYGDTTPVGLFTLYTSPYGVYDMAGNVSEWVADWYAADYYDPAIWPDTLVNPQGPGSGDRKVLRGGSFLDGSGFVRVSYREKHAPDQTSLIVGFRCVAD